MSKNDLFNESFSVTPPPSPGRSRTVSNASSPFAQRPKLAPLELGGPAFDTSAASSRQQALASASKVQLRVSASQIGSGRHATVFLASYRPAQEATWQVCAAKRLSADKEAQQAGINEACMLSRLSKCQQILRFLGLKDEQTTQSIAGSSAESKSVPSSPVDGSSYATFPALQSASSLRRAISVKQRSSRLSHSIEDTEEFGAPVFHSPSLYLMTEYCSLGNLATFVQAHGIRHLGRRMFHKLATDALQAIKYIHESNVIHADVKPQNFMLDSCFNLKLGDFSSSLFNSPTLEDGVALGTTNYAPPELVRPPPSPFSFPVDIFAAGLTLLFMLTGVEPYEPLLQGRKDHSISRGSRRKIRTSSGAGRTMELHLHLSKGNAWSFEEARRLEELEDQEGIARPILPSKREDVTIPTIHSVDLNSLSEDFAALPRRIQIPASLQDEIEDTFDLCRDLYDDGTPIQSFLSRRQVVPAELRLLIKSMISAEAENRPTAAEALAELKNQSTQSERR